MCLSIPAKILKIKDNKAIVDYMGEKKEMNSQLIKDIKIDDYAIASNGFLVKKISVQEAEEILKILHKKI